MTDNEIIKALELCSADECWCDDCPYENLCTDTDITKFALDLINRQKSEIERLNSPYEMQVEASKKLENSIKTEAVKEFAELLKEHVRDCYPYYYVIDEEVVDNLVEEMVGETNEQK